MLSHLYILNAPMFFEGFWESEIASHLSPGTLSKTIISGESTHPGLLESIE